jgi:Ser/Thr protein kinase RdoA (MazF antagonist)
MTAADPKELLAQAGRALRHWPELASGRLAPMGGGLINLTVRVEASDGERYVLQRLHPIFEGRLHLDIEAITARLAARSLATPRLVRTGEGELWVEEDGIWRVQTHLPGRTVQRVSGPAMAREAGALLGRFHAALAELDHEFHFVRKAHGLAMHADTLRQAVASHPHHRLASAVAPVVEDLLALSQDQPDFADLPQRITHGDPKISNVLFVSPADRAHAFVDLDTLGRLDLPTEMGDAFRSWCNPAGEDAGDPVLDLELFEAAVAGYASAAGGWVEPAEGALLVTGLLVLCTELACRFAADSLNESYFGWDPGRFPSHGDHNLHRARVQLALARSVQAHFQQAEDIVGRILLAPTDGP